MATIRLEIYLLLLCCSLNFAFGGVCPAGAPTVRIVDKCPTTRAEMEEAAQRKKCDMMKDSKPCDKPPVYHCLLNQWGNATVEVCTSPWYISGFCAIYNTVEMKVIDDFNRDCTNFTEGKCPSRYHSPEAYLYQSCYMKDINSTNPAKPITSHQQCNGSDNTAVIAVLGVVIVLLLVLTVILILERQGVIPKKGLLFGTCREDIENENSSEESPKKLNKYGELTEICIEDIENSTNDSNELKKLLVNYEEDKNAHNKSKENGSPGEKQEHGSMDDETKMNFQQKRERFESPQKHNQNKHPSDSKREGVKVRKSENEVVHGDLPMDDDEKHIQNPKETESRADDNKNTVTDENHSTDTEKEENLENANASKSENSDQKEESKVPEQETGHNNHSTDSIVNGSGNAEPVDQSNKDTVSGDLDKPPEETIEPGRVDQLRGLYEPQK
uniref:Uncharacterized protein LOC111102563 isoform X3 n=1 Tax=Crassostrea virginica TaxID=6565 RepID=A0A8B8AHS6_CRAVI|nr:uncharacterized protein LOC111102563 isoform X3 [Crassostrea virginica]